MAISLKRFLLSALALCSLSFAHADPQAIVVNNFSGGLDTLDSPAAIASNFAQNLLNVNIQPGGSAVYKRDGYGLFQSLGTNQPIHGAYHFQQTGGSDVQLWASSQTVYGIVSDASAVALATGTFNATWQCTDSQGNAYCFSSSNDTPIQTDGTKANTSYLTANSFPAGTMAAFTPLQLVVAGVTGNTNTIYISQQLAFTNFTVGVLPSSSFTEPIASPGSRITHLAYYFGRLFWWKDQSFGYATFTGQNDWQMTIVSNQIGTLDNSDAFWNSSGFDSGTMFSGIQQANANASPGGIFFRGQDNHLYVYDGYYLTRLSRIITPTVVAASKRKSNSWMQNTSAQFNNGSIVPSGQLSTTIVTNAVTVSSLTTTENSNTQWNNGTTNNTTINSSSVTLTVNNSGNVTNNSFETGTLGNLPSNWTNVSSGWAKQSSGNLSGLTQCGGSFTNVDGSFFAQVANGDLTGSSPFLKAQLVNASNTVLASQTYSLSAKNCAFASQTFTVPNSLIGTVVYLDFAAGPTNSIEMKTSSAFVLGGNITFLLAVDENNAGTAFFPTIDKVGGGVDSITTGTFTSQIYNSKFSSATYSVPTFTYAANTTTPTFVLQTSTSSTGTFSTLINNTTATNAVGNQYYQYVVTFPSLGATDNALSQFNSINIIAESTGTFYSAVNNAPNLTSWNNLNIIDNEPNGNSSITYYSRSSTNTFTVTSSTPSWVAQSKNATVTASTGTYFQLRADFAVTAATETPTMNSFIFNWFEGTASDKAYITYFNDAIWFSVSSSTNVNTNNTIFYWDLLNGAWSDYNIPADGFLTENGTLYFGDPTTTGNIYKYGGVTTDNGSAINSYWRSKAFLYNEQETSGNGQTISFPATDSLFVQKEFTQADFVIGESSTTMSYTYTLDSKTATTFTFTAYDPSASLIQRNFLLPIGKIGKYYDFQIGDNSSNAAWKVFAHRVIYNPLMWKPVLN